MDREADLEESDSLLREDSQTAAAEEETASMSVMFYLKQGSILRNLVVMAFVWSITAVCYYINNTFLK